MVLGGDKAGPTEGLAARGAALARAVAAWTGAPPERVRLVRSPYRACPLGAHVDHQLGHVTGFALDRALLLAFVPTDDGRVVLRSRQFPGEASFPAGEPGPAAGDWADYARGAAFALNRRAPLRRGIAGIVDGYDDVGGLSSSAAAGVAYLLALEDANGLPVGIEGNIELDRVVENDYIGLSNGILDQSCILLGRAGRLLHLDCRSGQSQLVPLGGGAEFSVVVLFSGLRARLCDTDYNARVRECCQAAGLLLRMAGLEVPAQARLRDVPPEAFEEFGGRLPARLRRRAAHFFTEQERVRQGIALWERGDLAAFGELMNESGRSSIENYECGNAYLRAAYEALRVCEGVYGARFSGAGFRGCCVGLARPGAEAGIAREALAAYLAACPDMQDRARVYFCRSADGAALMDVGGSE